MMNLKLKNSHGVKASVLIEMIGTLLMSTALFASAFFFMTIFEVAQKQTMLVRTQAFLELGNYSTFGLNEHGQDDIEDDQSKVMFMLGENTAGTRVDLGNLKNFDSFAGEMTIDVADSSSTDRFWSTFRFPKAFVRYTWTNVTGSDTLNLRNDDMPNHQVLGIVHNRSIDLSGDLSIEDLADGETGIYSGSTRFSDLSRLAQTPETIGEGLIDNTSGIEAILAEIVRDDPSLAEDARNLRSEISGSDAILGGAQASLISAAISNALSIASFAAAGGFSGAAQGGGGFFQGVDLIDGAHLHNFGQLASFAGGAITTGAAVASAFGSYNEDLFTAGAVVSGVGSLASGASDIGKYNAGSGDNGYSSGNDVYTSAEVRTGLNSQLFQGTSQVLGGSSQILGAAGADSDLVLGLGAASAVAGFGGSLASFDESINGNDFFVSPDAVPNENGIIGSGAYKQLGVDGSTTWIDGKKWAATSAVGGLVSGGAGLAAMAGIQNDAVTGVSLAGAGISLVGGAGSFSHQDNKFDGFDNTMGTIAGGAGLAAGAAGLTAGVASLAGADGLAETAGYASLGASAVAATAGIGLLVSQVGQLAKDGAEEVGSWFDGKEEGEGGEGSKVKPPDTRTATKKLEDGLNTVAQIGNPAAAVAMAAGALQQANQAQNSLEAEANAEIAQAQSDAQAGIAQAQQDYQDTIASIAASAASAGANSSSSPNGSSSVASATNFSSYSSQAQVQIVNGILGEVTQLDVDAVAAKLPPDRAQDVRSAVTKIEKARERIAQAEEARLPPSEEDLELVAEAYAELQVAIGEANSSNAVANSSSSNDGPVDVLGASFRMNDLQFHQRNMVNRMAAGIRRRGAKETMTEFRQMKLFDVSLLTATRAEISKVDDAMIEKAFDEENVEFVKKGFSQLEKNLARYEVQIREGQIVLQEEINEDWKLIDDIQKIVDQKNGLPPKETKERQELEEKKYRESVRLIEEEDQKLRQQIQDAERAYELVYRSETRVRFRPILVKNRSQKLAVQDVGYENASIIATYREEHLKPNTEIYERFLAAEWTWTRINFEYYDDYIERVTREVKNAKNFVKRTNEWAIQNPRLLRQAQIHHHRMQMAEQNN